MPLKFHMKEGSQSGNKHKTITIIFKRLLYFLSSTRWIVFFQVQITLVSLVNFRIDWVRGGGIYYIHHIRIGQNRLAITIHYTIYHTPDTNMPYISIIHQEKHLHISLTARYAQRRHHLVIFNLKRHSFKIINYS